MPPIITLSALANADQFLSPVIRQPDLLTCNVKIILNVPLLSIDRRNDWKVNQRHPKQFHQVQRERRRLRTRPMKKAKRWIEPYDHDRVHYVFQQKCIAK